MCNSNGFGGGSCCWIIILIIILFCCCGSGNSGCPRNSPGDPKDAFSLFLRDRAPLPSLHALGIRRPGAGICCGGGSLFGRCGLFCGCVRCPFFRR